jgi:hypothetical protein
MQHYPIDPAELIAFHREHFGDAVMTHPAPPAPQPPAPPAPAPAPPAPPAPQPPAPSPADGSVPDDAPELAHLTPEERAALGDAGRRAIIRERQSAAAAEQARRDAETARAAAEQARRDAEAEAQRLRVAQLPADQQAIELARQEAAEAARREAEQANATQLATERASRILAEARATALEAGARPERLAAFVRVLDLSGVATATGEIDEARLRQIVDAELEATPEFRRADVAPPPRRAAPGSGQGAQPPAPVDQNAKVAETVGAMQKALGRRPAPAPQQ